MANSDKVREDRLRRMARRQGYELRKNPRRDPRATDYGSYMLVDPATSAVAADFGWVYVGYPQRGTYLDDVEAYLTSERKPS